MDYLKETYFFNYSHPEIQAFLQEQDLEGLSDKEITIKLYYLIRDGWKYDPYNIFFEKERWQSHVLFKKTTAHCLDKSILLITMLRAKGIPARLHLAKVKNHIAAEKLLEKYQTDELAPHGYVEIFLDNRWIAATPAFNKSLCLRLNVAPLEFNGEEDSIFQEFDKAGNTFMEYLEDYGHFEDFPYSFVIETFQKHYPDYARELILPLGE